MTVCGELDIATVPELARTLRDEETSSEVVIVDLRGVDFVDSSGLHVIIATHMRLLRAGRRLIVVRGSTAVQRVFALSGVDRELELVDTLPERPI